MQRGAGKHSVSYPFAAATAMPDPAAHQRGPRPRQRTQQPRLDPLPPLAPGKPVRRRPASISPMLIDVPLIDGHPQVRQPDRRRGTPHPILLPASGLLTTSPPDGKKPIVLNLSGGTQGFSLPAYHRS